MKISNLLICFIITTILISFGSTIAFAQEITAPPNQSHEVTSIPCNTDEDCSGSCMPEGYLKIHSCGGGNCGATCKSWCNQDNSCQIEINCIPTLSEQEIYNRVGSNVSQAVGEDYYSEHYQIIDNSLLYDGSMEIIFEYTTDLGDKFNMSAGYASCSDETILGDAILLEPLIVTIDKTAAEDIARANGLIEPYQEPISGSNIMYGYMNLGKITWAIYRDYEPTDEDKQNEVLSGFIIDATNGDIIEEKHYGFYFGGLTGPGGGFVSSFTTEVVLFYGGIIVIIILASLMIYSRFKNKK